MFDTVESNTTWTSDVAVLLTQLISSGMVDAQVCSRLDFFDRGSVCFSSCWNVVSSDVCAGLPLFSVLFRSCLSLRRWMRNYTTSFLTWSLYFCIILLEATLPAELNATKGNTPTLWKRWMWVSGRSSVCCLCVDGLKLIRAFGKRRHSFVIFFLFRFRRPGDRFKSFCIFMKYSKLTQLHSTWFLENDRTQSFRLNLYRNA